MTPIQRTAEFLRDGKIVAIKGLGGFHLAVDATSEQAVKRLRQLKIVIINRLPLWLDSIEAAAGDL